MTSMRAMVLHRPGPVEQGLAAEERPVPAVGPEEILIRVRACGVCHTDVHIVAGELPPARLPIIPGHQVVGIVERAGAAVTRFAPGDRVGVPWLAASCGRCDFCLRGRENLCQQAQFTGYHVDGGYADYLVARARYAYPIPDAFDDLAAAPLLCAGIIGYRALRLSEIQPGGVLGLFGFGASAHLAIQVARHWGCEVYVFTRSAAHRELALRLGAAWTGTSADRPPRPLDSAVVFAPAGAVVVDALASLRRGGVLAINAIHLDRIPAFDYGLLYWERTMRSVANFTRDDAEAFLALAAQVPVRVQTTPFALQDANRALAAVQRGEIPGAAVLDVGRSP